MSVIADNAAIAHAAQLLQQGGLVAFPTETVYGLGADAMNATAVARIFAAKGRPADHPLIVHIAAAAQLSAWAETIPAAAYALAEAFWPGPLALVLHKKASVPYAVTGGQETVGLRVPNHPVALQLLQQFGGGIAAPSANRFCRISPTLAAHVEEELGAAVDLILDGGACQVGVESTIVDLSGLQPRLLRPGQISVEAINAVLHCELLLPETLQHSTQAEIRAPGMLALHYAPDTAARMYVSGELPELLTALQQSTKKIGLLHYTELTAGLTPGYVLRLPNNPEQYAQLLYSALRELDHQQLDLILIEQPPSNSLWRAINDRLSKATH